MAFLPLGRGEGCSFRDERDLHQRTPSPGAAAPPSPVATGEGKDVAAAYTAAGASVRLQQSQYQSGVMS
ncbi:hypothetical protein BH09CHL1_BH09CHL1_16320 [soil metagenome]